MYQTNLKNIPLLFRGKVRDVYDLGQELLLVTTDRISAFDVILPDPIPQKGIVLSKLSNFWFNKFKDLVPSHVSKTSLRDVVKNPADYELIKDQAVVVKKAKPLPVECIVRGYLLGTGYKDYQQTGKICGIELPKGLQLAEKLPEPIFTPAIKAEFGNHDENISFEKVVALIGSDLANKVRSISLALYTEAARFAETKGIIIADTKFEFGILNNELILIDEVLTCDSSRFWAKEDYRVGISPPSFDKQIVRDYLETLDWNKTAPAPKLPKEIMEKAAGRYHEVLKKLTQ